MVSALRSSRAFRCAEVDWRDCELTLAAPEEDEVASQVAVVRDGVAAQPGTNP